MFVCFVVFFNISQLFQVAIQAAVGAKILARENIAALRKDVTAKCVSLIFIYINSIIERPQFSQMLSLAFLFSLLTITIKYGGDISRRMKLLKRQAEGKKRMKMVANIELPRETFIKVLKR